MKELIFVVETKASNDSDWMYIKSALDYYYKSRTYGIKKIYAKGKAELIHQDKKIYQHISKCEREPIVIICADYDREEEINKIIANYCFKNNYHLVWMNLDIEDVFWGNQVEQKEKVRQAILFQKRKNTLFQRGIHLSEKNPLKMRHSSNLLYVLDDILERNNIKVTIM